MATDSIALLTMADVAERLKVALRTVQMMVASGEIPVINLNEGRFRPNGAPMKRIVRICPDDLEKFKQERRQQRLNRTRIRNHR